MTGDWLDEALYPFAHRSFRTDGYDLHYVDDGSGEPLVFVHGTPTWSFLWRHLLVALRDRYRVVAPDHLGYGLSDKPAAADLTPAAHARRFAELLQHLDLQEVTLVVHDFGGPIGLAWALRHPERVKRVVLFNTWLWSNEGDRNVGTVSRLLGGPLGRFLYRRLNFSPRMLLPSAFGDRDRLSAAVHRHYLGPFPTPATREAPWVLARELMGSNHWYEGLWAKRALLRELPVLIIWGMRDRLMPPRHLLRWQGELPHARVVRIAESGHFPQEEAPDRVLRELEEFLSAPAPQVHEERQVQA